MRWPWVGRERCERAEAQVDGLLKQVERLTTTISTLKKRGYDLPTKKTVTEPVSDEEAVRQAEAGFRAKVHAKRDEFIERVQADLISQGVSRSDALKEAQRIRGEVESVTMHPGG